MERVSRQEYADAVAALIRVARQPTSGGRVAAQVLLSAYNGWEFQLDVASMGGLDRGNYHLALTVIRGRYEVGAEPHELLTDGSKIFRELWDQWSRLHVRERGKEICPDCDGQGTLWLNDDDENDTGSKPCLRCDGAGRICGCGGR